jgi:hypothetical protein
LEAPLRHRLWSIAAGQNASAIAQLYQAARILGHPAAIDHPGNDYVVMPINDLFLTSAFAALLEQRDGIFAFTHDASSSHKQLSCQPSCRNERTRSLADS